MCFFINELNNKMQRLVLNLPYFLSGDKHEQCFEISAIVVKIRMISVNEKVSYIANTRVVSFLHSQFKEVQVSVKIKEQFFFPFKLMVPCFREYWSFYLFLVFRDFSSYCHILCCFDFGLDVPLGILFYPVCPSLF